MGPLLHTPSWQPGGFCCVCARTVAPASTSFSPVAPLTLTLAARLCLIVALRITTTEGSGTEEKPKAPEREHGRLLALLPPPTVGRPRHCQATR